MSLKSANKIETNTHELEIEIAAETFNEAVNKAYLKERGKINVPGFRKGKAPKAFIEKVYGEGIFYETALDSIYPDAVEEAIKESGLDVVAPAFDGEVKEMSKETGVLITVKVTTKPEIEIGEYKGLELTRKSSEVTEDELNAEIESYREREAAFETVEDREAKIGDLAVIDFEGFVDGVAFEGGKAENYNLNLGSHSFIDTFEDQIAGHKVGDEFDVNVTFPEDYNAENLKGKPAIFKVKLNEIKEKVVPELDDEFAKDVSEFDTFDEFKADLVKHLEEHKKQHVEADIEGQIADKLAQDVKGEIPEVMYELKVDEFIREFEMRLNGQGINLEVYLNYTGMDMDALKVTYRAQAERAVKVALAIEKIAEIENIKASEDAINEEYSKIADSYKVEIDVAKKAIDESVISEEIVSREVIKFIKDNAKITDENK